MKIDELTVTVKVDDESYKKVIDNLNLKIQEIKNIKNEMWVILSDLDKMLYGKELLIVDVNKDK